MAALKFSIELKNIAALGPSGPGRDHRRLIETEIEQDGQAFRRSLCDVPRRQCRRRVSCARHTFCG